MLGRLWLRLRRMLVTRLKLRCRGKTLMRLYYDYANTSMRLRRISEYTTSFRIGAMGTRSSLSIITGYSL